MKISTKGTMILRCGGRFYKVIKVRSRGDNSYTFECKDEDYEETVASSPEEIRQLGKAGWQKYDELTVSGVQMHFYRKPKRFGGLKKLDDKVETGRDRFLS